MSQQSDRWVVPRASSGIAGLDSVLGGGFPTERLVLIEGDPGAGKTTLGLQFVMAGVAAGEPSMYVSLADTEREVRRMAASHGWNLDGIDLVRGGAPAGPASQQGYTLYHPAEVELEQISKSMYQLLDQHRPRRLVLDSLSELRLLAQDPLRYRRQILGLKDYLLEHGITALLIDFPSVSSDRHVESLCHGLVTLEQLSPEYGGQRRRLRIRKLRESAFRDGYHDFTIRRGGLEVYPRLVAAEHSHGERPRREPLASGIPGVDAVIGGGLDRGTSTLIMGPAGVGKSTLAAQWVTGALDRGEKAAVFVFDEVPDTFVVRGEGLGMRIRDHIEAGRLSLRQVDPAQLSPGAFAHTVRAAVEEMGASLIVIDSINGYQSAMPEEHFLHAHLHELLAYLNQMGVVTVLVMTQAGLVGQGITSPVELSYLADAIILLRYFEAGSEMRQALSVVKRRTGPHERTIRELKLTAKGLQVGNVLREFSGILAGQLVYSGNLGGPAPPGSSPPDNGDNVRSEHEGRA
jgi:circadian clock protein KaiC